jgi:hypothetical protein
MWVTPASPSEDPGALELDLLGSEAVEQTAPLAEEHRDDMELELVEDAGSKCELRGSGAMDQDVLVARGFLRLGHRGRDVVHVGDQRPLRQIGGVVAGEDEDRHAVVVVAAPAARRLEGPPAGNHCPCRHELVDDPAVDAAQTADRLDVVDAASARNRPLVQAVPAVPRPLSGPSLGPAMNPSRDVDM